MRDKRGSHLALSLARLDAARRAAAPAHRPLGDRAPHRRGRALPRRRGHARAPSSTSGTGAISTSPSRCPRTDLQAVATHEQWSEIYDRLAALVDAAPDDARLRQHAPHGRARRAPPRASASARTASARTTAASPRTGACASSSASRPARCARSSRPRRSSSGSTSARSTSSARSARRARSRRSSSASAARATRSGAPRAGASSRRRATSSSSARRSCAPWPRGRLDRVEPPVAPLDVLAQQIVAECAAREWSEDELFALVPAGRAVRAPRARATSTRSSPASPTAPRRGSAAAARSCTATA